MIRGADFRQEQRARLVALGALTTAQLMRWPRRRRLPTLDSLFQRRRSESQSAEQQSALLLEWARRGERQGLAIKVGRVDPSILRTPVPMMSPPNG